LPTEILIYRNESSELVATGMVGEVMLKRYWAERNFPVTELW